MIDLERARGYITAHGDDLARLRLAALLDQQFPAAVPPALAALQNADGGFAVLKQAGNPSALSPTAEALSWLRELHLATSPAAQQALAFIETRQHQRGIWREDAALQAYDLPLWMDPESPAADTYTTAVCASTLAQYDGNDLAVEQAVVWLQTQQGRDGLLAGFRALSSWLALPAFVATYGPDTRTTRRLVAGLGSVLDSTWPGSMLAGLLRAGLDAGYTRQTQVINRAWLQLQQAQHADGGFSVDEDDDPVQATLNALDVAQRLGNR